MSTITIDRCTNEVSVEIDKQHIPIFKALYCALETSDSEADLPLYIAIQEKMDAT